MLFQTKSDLSKGVLVAQFIKEEVHKELCVAFTQTPSLTCVSQGRYWRPNQISFKRLILTSGVLTCGHPHGYLAPAVLLGY